MATSGWSEAFSATRATRRGFILIAALAFGVVVLRSITVPFVHDEARAFFFYIRSGSVLPYEAKWDAANHLLVSLVTLGFYEAFGPAPWVIRAFPVLCYALFACYVWRAGEWFRDPVVRWCAWLAVLFMPFAFDFWSLFRGYGPSLAFLLMALVHGVRYAQRKQQRELGLLLLGAVLAALCNLSLLVLYAATLVWCAIFVSSQTAGKQRRTGLLMIGFFGVAPLLFIGVYAMELASRGLLYFGTDRGLFAGTLASVLAAVGSYGTPVRLAVALLCGCGIALAGQAVLRQRGQAWTMPLVMIASLICAELVGRVVLFHMLGVRYPLDRAALHWILLVVLLLVLAIDGVALLKPRWRWLAVVLLLLPASTLRTTSMHTTILWADQSVQPAVLEKMLEIQRAAARPLLIGTTEFTATAMAYEVLWRGEDLPVAQNGIRSGPHDLFLADRTMLLPGYRRVPVEAAGPLVLWERASGVEEELLLDSAFAPKGRIFMDLWNTGSTSIDGRSRLFEVELWCSALGDMPDADLVLDVKGEGDNPVLYDAMDLQGYGAYGRSGHVHTVRYLPSTTQGPRHVKLYVWDPGGTGLQVDSCHLRIWARH